jgi:hypothetical protein
MLYFTDPRGRFNKIPKFGVYNKTARNGYHANKQTKHYGNDNV